MSHEAPRPSPRAVKTGVRYPGVLLGLAALLASSLLSGVHLATKAAIAQRQAEDLQASLGQVIPVGSYDNDLLAHPLTITAATGEGSTNSALVYRAARQGEITAVAFRQEAPGGYGGPIQLLLGIDRNGTLLGVRVLSHKETPGLGDKIERAKSDWVDRFRGRSLDDPSAPRWTVKKQGGHFDQFTGATITPRAVIFGVKAGLQRFAQQRHLLLARTSPAAVPDSPPPEHQPPQDGTL